MARVAKVYKAKDAAKQARKLGITDGELIAAVEEVDAGNWYADLGKDLYKLRVNRKDDDSYRTIIAHKAADRPAFIFIVFAKNTLDNIGPKTKKSYATTAEVLFSLDQTKLDIFLNEGAIVECV